MATTTLTAGIFIAMMALSIPILAIVFDFIKDMVNVRVKMLAHQENIERMKNGYPPVEIYVKGKKGKKADKDIVVDLTVDQERESRAN